MKTAYFNRFDVTMPDIAAQDCAQSGQVDAYVEAWQKDGSIDLSHISDEKLAAELKECGAWDEEELKDRKANERRIIWIAACNIKEEEAENAKN